MKKEPLNKEIDLYLKGQLFGSLSAVATILIAMIIFNHCQKVSANPDKLEQRIEKQDATTVAPQVATPDSIMRPVIQRQR